MEISFSSLAAPPGAHAVKYILPVAWVVAETPEYIQIDNLLQHHEDKKAKIKKSPLEMLILGYGNVHQHKLTAPAGSVGHRQELQRPSECFKPLRGDPQATALHLVHYTYACIHLQIYIYILTIRRTEHGDRD